MDTSTKPLENKRPVAPWYAFVAPETRSGIERLPGLDCDEERMFLAYLRREPLDAEGLAVGRREVRVPYQVINECRGLAPTTSKTGEWLAAFCQKFGTTLTEWEAGSEDGKGRVRRVAVDFLDGVPNPLRHDAFDTFRHVVDGRPRADYVVAERLHPVEQMQRDVVRYIDKLPARLYMPGEADFQRAVGLAKDERQLRLLGACTLNVPPSYKVVSERKTDRLFADAWSDLPKVMRQAAWPHFVELDLRACHFAILEKIAADHDIRTPELSRTLDAAEGADTWSIVAAVLGVGPQHRKALKELVTATMYGAGLALRRKLCDEPRAPCAPIPRSALEQPLMKELVRVHRQLKTIAKKPRRGRGRQGGRQGLIGYDGNRVLPVAGGAQGPNVGGVVLKLQLSIEEVKAASLVHLVASQYELALLHPVLGVARDMRLVGVTIPLWQHDGCAICAPSCDLLRAAIDECAHAVAQRAAQLNVRTGLVAKTSLVAAPRAAA